MKKILQNFFKILPHLLFVALLLVIIFLPDSKDVEIENKIPFIIVAIIFEVQLLLQWKKAAIYDVTSIVFLILLIWDFKATKFATGRKLLLPSPENVFQIFVSDYPKIIEGLISSFRLLGIGFLFALVLGVVFGMITGWFTRVYDTVMPIVKVISPIPAIIYTPYAIACLPSFQIAQIFVLAISMFWGIFLNIVYRVSHVEKEIVDSARTLNLSSSSMFFHILFPYSVPSVINALSGSLTSAFMVLTAAEMIGARSGLGWFVKYYSDYADYTRVVAGIIIIGIVVTVLNIVIKFADQKLVRWH
ncbi:MAG: ABC transporter permease subunit [Lachnospiraceae bacterium]|nr:ABC transporter permease subunit [Lachnospiraceae bacterium]